MLLAAEQGGDAVAPDSSESLIAILEQFSGSRAEADEERLWSIHFRPSPDLLACGGNPAALFRDLRKLGPCEITAHTDDIPALDELQPDVCYLHWTIRLRTASDR